MAKCLPDTVQQDIARTREAALTPKDEAYRAALRFEDTKCCVAALTILALAEREELEQQLITFSVLSQLERITREGGYGLPFQKQNELYLILEVSEGTDPTVRLRMLLSHACETTGWSIGAVCGPVTERPDQLPKLAMECRQKSQYFYFWRFLPDNVLQLDRNVFPQKDLAGLHTLQEAIADNFVGSDRAVTWKRLKEYEHICASVADGNQDSAVFYLLNCLRAITERMSELGIQADSAGLVDSILDSARNAKSYDELTRLFEDTCSELYDKVTQSLRKSEKKEIVKATDYIKAHYKENLTLEVLANEVHMNPFYFSSYFKKQTGRNFKDFLNRVRLRHALELLVGTDLRSYEIAEEVGFKYHRYFTEQFNREYGRTPTAYRKAMSAAPTLDEE